MTVRWVTFSASDERIAMDAETVGSDVPRRPTMKDVAAHAGVGLSTVSRVVSGGAGVTPAKVRAVERAITQLGFSRNDFARTLRTGATGTIGVVVRDISDPFFASLTAAVADEAQARDRIVLVAAGTDDPGEAMRVLRRLSRRRLDGLIITPPDLADLGFLQQEISAGTSVVVVDSPASGLDVDTVVADNRGGMASAVRLLADAGHRRIGCLAHTAGVYTSLERRAGFREAMAERGLPADDDLVAVVADNDVASSTRALERLLAREEPVTAVVATNGRVLRALAAARRAVGFEGDVVGFDDFDLADLLVPAISTIAQDPQAMGRAAARRLFERIDGDRGPARLIQLRTHLIVRRAVE